MEVSVSIEEGLDCGLDEGRLEGVAGQVLAAEGVGPSAEMSLFIAGQERVRGLNRDYRGKDEPTDVLAFAMLPAGGDAAVDSPPFIMPPDGVLHLGEVVISYPQALAQAEEHRHPVEQEITLLLIHGVLHLLGYDHDGPELERGMRAREAELLAIIEGG